MLILIFFSIIAFGIVLHFIYYKLTKFSKKIKVMKKEMLDINGTLKMCITDENGKQYTIGPCIWELSYPDDILELIVEKIKYNVDGYGIELKYFHMGPVIYNIK